MAGNFPKLYGGALSTIVSCLGEPVTYRPKKGGTFNIDAVFDEIFRQVDADTEEVVASNVPRIGIKLADIPFEPEQGDEVRIGKRVFRVTDSQEDGLGGSTILLHEVKR